jgi:hypothetical protein
VNNGALAFVTSSDASPRRDAVAAALQKTRAYLYSRQSDHGGFCFYKSDGVDEPNLGDTYHALAALKLLHAPVPHVNALLRFLDEASILGPGYLHAYAFALDLLDHAERIDPARLARIAEWPVAPPRWALDAQGLGGWLHHLLCLLRLKQRFAQLEPCPELVAYIQDWKTDGGYGREASLTQTYLALSVLRLLGVESAEADVRDFVNDLQVLPFGFTETRHCVSANIDVVYAGVQCCALLGLSVRHGRQVLDFTLACQTEAGSFSRAPVALPDIELTHRALQILQVLQPRAFDP